MTTIAVLATACTHGSSFLGGSNLFGPPVPYPGVTWTHHGAPVPAAVISATAGSKHCGWQSATFLTIKWPVGTAAPTVAARVYVRDPFKVISDTSASLDTQSPLPGDAKPTGYRTGDVEVYFAPSDQDRAVYLVSPGRTERWPRQDPRLCI